ncbi:HEAT repeat domain-containing protein, partial [bacterium]|nr:HEAT repeat domain-containing protein [bacterium]
SANDYSHLTDDFLQKFRVILKHGHDFQKKIMVMKIIDNLAKTEFIDLVESQLKNEKNHFLISSYVKFLGKYGGIKYVKILKPYLESKDERIVANCLEGLANCGTDEELDEIFCRFITGQNHRIASISAMALWNNGKKKIVIDYIDNNINNRKLWIRKAIINILQQINSSELSSQIQVLCQDKNKEIRKTAKAIIADFDKVNGVSDSPTELIQYILDNGKIPDKIISDIIVKIKSKDKSLSERIQAIEFLSYVATEEHYKKIYKLYRGARNQVMKAALVKTLGITFSGGREFLLDILKEDFDPKIIASALEGLGFYDCSLYVDDIFPFLYHEDRKIVANAAVLLYEIMPEEILRKFSVMIDSPSEAVRKSSVFALAEIKTYESYLLIRKLLNDADLDIAISASKIIAVFDKETDFLELFEKEKDDNSVKKVSKEDSSELKTDLLIEYFNKLDTSTVEEIGSLINDIGKLVNQDNIDFLLSYIETSQNEMAISKIISLLGMFLDIPRVYDLVDLFLNGDDYSHIRSVISGFNNVYENPYFIEKLMEYLSSENIGLSEIAFRILLSNPVYGKEMYRLIDNSDSEVKPVFDYIIKKLPSTWLPVTVQSVAEEKSPEVVENHLKGFIDDISEHISDDSKTEIQEETVIESEKTPVETIEEDHVEDNKIVLDNFFYILNEMSDSKNNDDLDETICELKRMDLKDYTSEMIKLIEKSDNEQLVLELCSFLGKYSSEMDVFNILEKLLRHKDTNIRCRIIESLVDSPEPVFFEDLSAMIFKEEFLVVKSAWKVFLLNRVYGESYFQKFDKKMYEKYLKPEIKNPKSSVKIPEKKSRKNQLSDTPVISQKLAFISLNMKQTFAITAGSIVLIFLFFFAGYLSSGTLIEPIFSNGKKASVIFTDSNDLSVDQLKTNWIEFKNENAPSDKITSTLIGYIQNSEKNFGTETFNRVKTSLKSGDIKIADQEFMSVIAHLKNGDVLKDGKKWIKRQIVEKAIFDNIKKILVQ